MEYSFDTLTIELSRILNCSQGYRPTVELSGDTLIFNTFLYSYLETDKTGDTLEWVEEFTYCNCYFRLVFQIAPVPDTPAAVLHNAKAMQKIPDRLLPYFTINELQDTVWQHDQEGFIYTNKTLASGKTVWIEKSNLNQRIIRNYNSKELLVTETIINFKANPKVINKSYYYNASGELLRVEEEMK